MVLSSLALSSTRHTVSLLTSSDNDLKCYRVYCSSCFCPRCWQPSRLPSKCGSTNSRMSPSSKRFHWNSRQHSLFRFFSSHYADLLLRIQSTADNWKCSSEAGNIFIDRISYHWAFTRRRLRKKETIYHLWYAAYYTRRVSGLSKSDAASLRLQCRTQRSSRSERKPNASTYRC